MEMLCKCNTILSLFSSSNFQFYTLNSAPSFFFNGEKHNIETRSYFKERKKNVFFSSAEIIRSSIWLKCNFMAVYMKQIENDTNNNNNKKEIQNKNDDSKSITINYLYQNSYQ